jgi:hypothetical protein
VRQSVALRAPVIVSDFIALTPRMRVRSSVIRDYDEAFHSRSTSPVKGVYGAHWRGCVVQRQPCTPICGCCGVAARPCKSRSRIPPDQCPRDRAGTERRIIRSLIEARDSGSSFRPWLPPWLGFDDQCADGVRTASLAPSRSSVALLAGNPLSYPAGLPAAVTGRHACASNQKHCRNRHGRISTHHRLLIEVAH